MDGGFVGDLGQAASFHAMALRTLQIRKGGFSACDVAFRKPKSLSHFCLLVAAGSEKKNRGEEDREEGREAEFHGH
jgi:hypothetical protein